MNAPDFLGYRGARALVTGAGSGIGRAVALQLAAHGADVALVGRRMEPLQETIRLARTATNTTAKLHAISADLSVEATPADVVQETLSTLAGLNLLVNAAAMLHREPATGEVTAEDVWSELMQTNLRAPYLLAKHAVSALGEGNGSIVNLSSIWAHIGARNQVAYSTSKAAIVELTRSLALDFAPLGVRVNCVCASTTRTPLLQRGRSSFDEAAAAQAHPLGRIGEPEDIANAVLYLGSRQAAGWVTGTALTVDGGYTIQ